MADNLSSAGASAALGGVTPSMLYVQLHIGPPGPTGTTNVSSTTTRVAVTWSAPASGTVATSSLPQWGSWAGTNGETVTDISLWTAASGGTFEGSMPLNSPIQMLTGDTLTLTSIAITIPTAS